MPSGSCWLVLTSSKEGSYWLLTFKCYSSTIFWGWADHVDRQGLKDKHVHSKAERHIGVSAIDSTEHRCCSSMCACVSLSTALADTWAQLKNTAASSWITNYGLSWKQCHTPTKRRSRMPYLPRLISGVAYKNVHKVKIHSKWKSMQLECAVQRVKFHPQCLNLEALQSHLGGSDNEDGWQWHAEVRHNVT